jgi:CRP/FNR family cyclic AMP-dependent transcriptional regulator
MTTWNETKRANTQPSGAQGGRSEADLLPAVTQAKSSIQAAGRPHSAEERRLRIRDALADSDVFGALSDDELDQLIARGYVAVYGARSMIFHECDPGESLMIVLSGRIKIGITSPDGREATIGFINPGHCCGEIALLDGGLRSADAMAAEPSEVLVLGRREVIAFIDRHPDIAFRIMGVLCARLRRATGILADRMLPNVESRIASVLLRLSGEYGSHCGAGTRVDLRLSQGQLGALAGTTRERVNRHLGAWSRDGVIAVDEGYLTILDMAALRALAELQTMNTHQRLGCARRHTRPVPAGTDQECKARDASGGQRWLRACPGMAAATRGESQVCQALEEAISRKSRDTKEPSE